MMISMDPLPLAQPAPEETERSDAAANRRRILAAAEQLFAERGAESVSMQDVAKAAGVGMGTMYRRFGDREGLTYALLSDTHREFQERMLRGEPPLGPGAPPRERLHAFGRGYLETLELNAPTLAAAGGHPALGGPDLAYRMHLALLFREAEYAGDLDYAVLTLLAAFEARLFLHMRRQLGWSLERVQDGWCALVDGLLAAGDR